MEEEPLSQGQWHPPIVGGSSCRPADSVSVRGVRDHLISFGAALGASDRAALQRLTPLAGGAAILLEVEPSGGGRREPPTALRLATPRPGADPPRHTATLTANADGLFDVSELVG